MYFNANCATRGAPVPNDRAEVICPKVPSPTVLSGLLKFGWLNRLNSSPRNCTLPCSHTGNSLNSEKSKLIRLGPVRKFLPVSPNVPPAAFWNAAVLKYAELLRPPGGNAATPVRSAVSPPTPVAAVSSELLIEYGEP